MLYMVIKKMLKHSFLGDHTNCCPLMLLDLGPHVCERLFLFASLTAVAFIIIVMVTYYMVTLMANHRVPNIHSETHELVRCVYHKLYS